MAFNVDEPCPKGHVDISSTVFVIQPMTSLIKAVLVLAGVEFIFFIVASMGLCFGFVLETVLITQGCFCYC